MIKLWAAAAAAIALPAAGSAATFAFTPGDLVVSLYGNVDGTTNTYSNDNDAAPIYLQQLAGTAGIKGVDTGGLLLPQTATTVNGVTQSAISGEYGSSSEGYLQLSGDGRSLTLMGYGITATTFNQNPAATYGDARLAQSTSMTGGSFTPISRVVALVGADGSTDTSTALFGVFDGNNPRSAYTVDGSSFYVSGQGQSGSTNQGVFLAGKGASSATVITTASDTRDVSAHNGQLLVSVDTKQNAPATIDSLGTAPQGKATPTPFPGIGPTVNLTTATENGINNSRAGNTVNLSPDQYFFANDTTLYIADSGAPKQGGAEKGGLGDGGLQKWSLVNGSWVLDYTLANGLNLVDNSGKNGTTGLFALAGSVMGDAVTLFATNYTINDLDQSYVYKITDSLSASAAATTGPNDVFTAFYTPIAGVKVKGVSFAPTLGLAAPVPEPGTWTMAVAGLGLVGAALRSRRAAGSRRPAR